MKNPFEHLWHDRMDVYRWNEIEADGVSKSIKELMYSNIKCHYSKDTLADTDNTIPAIKNSYTLFCAIDIDLQEGDEIIVIQRNGKKVKLTVGEGFPYSGHQEFSVKRGDAV